MMTAAASIIYENFADKLLTLSFGSDWGASLFSRQIVYSYVSGN